MIKIIKYTPNPITFMGECATVCTDYNNPKANYNIGLDCLNSNHGRVFEYPDVIIEISKYSARMIRELYTHILGTTRLQESTRYVKTNEDFSYYVPISIQKDKDAYDKYSTAMKNIQEIYSILIDHYDIPKQDAANLLPLGMDTKVVLKINLRAIMHMFEERTCIRAYEEFREFMTEFKYEVEKLDVEWNYLSKNYFITKCDKAGYCVESKSCGRKPQKKEIIK